MRYRRPLQQADYTILQDDREKHPWTCLHKPVEVKRLKTGDYTIKGWEKQVAIEKKSGLVELLTNLSAPSRPRFVRFLKRLRDYQVRIIVVEQVCTEEAVRRAVAIVREKSQGRCCLDENTLWHWIGEIQTYYQIPMLMVEKRAVPYVVPKALDAAYRKVKGA